MKKAIWLCGVAMALAVTTGEALAVGKAGLWNAAMTMNLGGAAPAIPPAALAQMRALGMSIPGVGGAPIRTQVCMSAEQAAADSPPPPQNGCRNQNVRRDGNTITGDLVCMGEMNGTGNFTFTQVSADEMRNSFSFKGTNRGQPADFNAEMVLTYAAANCGNVQPYAP